MSYSSYDEIMPPSMGEYGGLGAWMDELWPQTGEVMDFGKAGVGVVGGFMAARYIENMLTGRNVPRFLIPVIHGVAGIAAAKWISKWDGAIGAGIAGAFGAKAVVSALDLVLGANNPLKLNGLGDDLGDLLGGDTILPGGMSGYDGIDVSVETRQIGAGGGGGGMGGVSVETQQMAGWSWR